MLSVRRVFVSFAAAGVIPALAAAQSSAPPVVVTAGEGGVVVQSQNGDYQIRFGALVNADARAAIGDDTSQVVNTFAIRRLRPTLRGRLARYFEFYINPDFAGSTLVVQDAYLDTVFSPAFRVRFGKTKTPFGLERMQSMPYTLFFERSLATAPTPNRDVGVQAIGDLAGGVVSYAGGVFNGVPDGGSADLDTNDSKDVAGRILVRPFQRRAATDPLHGLAIGVAATRGRQSGTAALPTLRTASLQQTIFLYSGARAEGMRTRYSPHASYVYKSFSGLAEYVHSEVPLQSGEAQHRAWQVAGSFLLTGEAATDGTTAVRPHANFDLGHGHWGAVQVVARYHRLDVGDDAVRFAGAGSATTAKAWTTGVNWYLTPNLRYLVNVERTVFEGAAAPRPAENALVFRSQVSF
jgi:phosphate-selective porin OprO/OprP